MADMDMLSKKVEGLKQKKSTVREQMDKKYAEIAQLQKQMDKLDDQIEQVTGVTKEDAGIGASDAGTTTATLDASSETKGGDYGGWRHYKKIGDVATRKSGKKKKKKKKNEFKTYISRVWDSAGEVDGGGE